MIKKILLTLTVSVLLPIQYATADFSVGMQAYQASDYATALAQLEPEAANGNRIAQNIVGVIYMSGLGVSKDDSKAMKWFRLGADQGYAVAQTNVGFLYENGRGVKQDFAEARKWYEKAAKQGDRRAIFVLESVGRKESLLAPENRTGIPLAPTASSVVPQKQPSPDDLTKAIFKADVGTVKSYLSKGASVRTRDKDGFAPLVSAVMIGSLDRTKPEALEIANLLIEAGADIEQQGPAGNTPLTAAAGQTNYPELVTFLLEKGANIDFRGYNATTALYQSVRRARSEISEILIRHGANVNAKADDGWTPLHLAAINGMEATTQLLIDKGANVNARDAEGKTALAWARGHIPRGCMQCRSLATPTLLELLVRSGATE